MDSRVVIVLIAAVIVSGSYSLYNVSELRAQEEETDDVFSQIEGLIIAISALMTTAMGIVVYVIQAKNSIQKKELTERDKQIMEIAKGVQIGIQKSAETIGQVKGVAKVIYEANVPEEQRQEIQAKLDPILTDSTERLQKANEQAVMVKGKLVELLGDQADVDLDQSLPRESQEMSTRLRKV